MWIGALLLLVLAGLAAAVFWLWTPDRPRSELEAKYLAGPGDMIEVAGNALHVRDTGGKTAPAVILLHGLGAHLQTWDGWADTLQSDFRVIRFDLPGAGLSAPDATGDYTDERSVALLLALMDELGVKTASLIGNSIGGRIAWKFAAAHPKRVDNLVLVAPDGYASPGFEYGKPADVPATMSAMKYVLPKSMLRQNLELAYGDPEKLSGETLDRYHELMLAPGNRAAFIERMRQTVLVPPEPILRKIEAPVLLLWGEKDQMIPATNAADYERVLPGAELAILPNLGHVPHEEAPAASLKPVLAFLRDKAE